MEVIMVMNKKPDVNPKERKEEPVKNPKEKERNKEQHGNRPNKREHE